MGLSRGGAGDARGERVSAAPVYTAETAPTPLPRQQKPPRPFGEAPAPSF